MHELLLHASVPAARHAQVLSILAGIAAMQPQTFHEKHLIYKPTRPATRTVAPVGGTQAIHQGNPMQAVQGAMQGDLFYLHLVEDMAGETDKGVEANGKAEVDGDVVMDEVEGGEGKEEVNGVGQNDLLPTTIPDPSPIDTKPPTTKQTLQFRDIPAPGSRLPCASRLMADIPITGGDAAAFMSAMEYTHTSTHHLIGHRLTHLSTSLLLFQPCLPSSSSSLTQIPKPLDPQTYILQLSLRVSDGTKPELMSRGVKELMGLKEMLRGVVELESVERGLLDMRVR